MKIRIAENIRCFRKECALTQEQLAEALGVTVGAVYKWEAGLSTPEIRLIMEMADLFEISVDVLLGYEQQNGRVEAVIARMEQYCREGKLAEATQETEKALKKYPNHFQLVCAAAQIYQLKYMEDKEDRNVERSNELLRHGISLLYQNTDPNIGEVTLQKMIAENNLMVGRVEEALESLKQNNIYGINNSIIGLTYASVLHCPEEAKPYLVQAFSESLKNMLQSIIGLANMYAEMNNEIGMEAMQWLMGLLDSLKVDGDSVTYTDKLKAVLLVQYGVWEASLKHFDSAREYTGSAYELARKFDAAPVYSVRGLKFFEGEEENSLAYDDTGKTAMEAVENVLGEEATQAHQYIQGIWEELKNEGSN